jgi:hypothetical protein
MNYGLAQSPMPFNEQNNYFETKIIDCGDNKKVDIGLYPHHSKMKDSKLIRFRHFGENGECIPILPLMGNIR